MSKSALDEMIEGVEQQKAFTQYPKTAWLELHNDGKYLMRGLPIKDAPNKFPAYRVFVHSGYVDPNRGTKSVFRCIGTGCPLCADAKAAEKSGHEQAWRKKARVFFLYNILDGNGNIRVLKAPQKLNEEIQREWLAKAKGERINIFDLNDGHVFEITRKGAGDKTKWTVKVALEPHKVKEEDLKKLERSRPLNDLYMSFTKEQLQMVLDGVAWKQKQSSAPAQQQNHEPEQDFSSYGEPEQSFSAEPMNSSEPAQSSARVDLFPVEEEELSEPVEEASQDEVAAMKEKIFGKKKAK